MARLQCGVPYPVNRSPRVATQIVQTCRQPRSGLLRRASGLRPNGCINAFRRSIATDSNFIWKLLTQGTFSFAAHVVKSSRSDSLNVLGRFCGLCSCHYTSIVSAKCAECVRCSFVPCSKINFLRKSLLTFGVYILGVSSDWERWVFEKVLSGESEVPSRESLFSRRIVVTDVFGRRVLFQTA